MPTDYVIIIFEFVVLIFSVVIHEVSHGYLAERLGDPTARLSGRLTLNPLSHIDPFGSILLPALLALSHLPVFGWAKPVPYNPYNLRDPIVGGGKIAAAGPVSNLILAVIFAALVRGLILFDIPAPTSLFFLFVLVVKINVVLAIFNLVPLPPFDGSKILYAFLPFTKMGSQVMQFLEQYSMILIVLFIFFGYQFIEPIMNALFLFLLGLPPGTL